MTRLYSFDEVREILDIRDVMRSRGDASPTEALLRRMQCYPEFFSREIATYRVAALQNLQEAALMRSQLTP